MMSRLVAAILVATFATIAPSIEAKQHRSTAVKNAFKITHPCPANDRRRGPCPGYVIDHIIPLCAGGPDATSNMQWQTIAAGKIKDKTEILSCRKRRT